MINIDRMYEILLDYCIATEDEINLVTKINGWNEQSMLDILYVRTGYTDFTQFVEELDKED